MEDSELKNLLAPISVFAQRCFVSSNQMPQLSLRFLPTVPLARSPPECAAALSSCSKGKAEAGQELAPPHFGAWLEVNSPSGPGEKGQPSNTEKVGGDI